MFWSLPHWNDNLVRHCLDVMHMEKNVLDHIINTVMDTDRTKDNEKARLDLAELCKRPDLHLRHVGDNCWSKPKAAYTLTSEQQQDMYRWVQQLRFSDGYASNLWLVFPHSQSNWSLTHYFALIEFQHLAYIS